ncbi:hypothetical protein H7H73_02750 [Mycobacterium rufum]|uniref:Uncharacterized protein n=1 Tax=Mycolicibacterium rufum TaxID=318424 RepID=A0A9X3BMM6_9MYCO|nr:hypothetical protein [Mycolicibacterium rufum]
MPAGPPPVSRPRAAVRIPGWSVPLFFVVGAVSQYVGAAIGVTLFETTARRPSRGCARRVPQRC